jgi:DNA-binding transcriptional MocR family regulator
MSYKDKLSDIDREGSRSVTAQISDAFANAIETGELEPGEQLPPTRELAEIAGVNHLTAARAYRRLAEMGLVAGRVGRGTFVRQAAPEASRVLADDEGDGSAWQLYALPDEVEAHSDRIVGEMFRQAHRDDLIPLLMGYPSNDLFPSDRFGAVLTDVVGSEGSRLHQYGDVEGVPELREELASLGARQGWAASPEEIVTTTGAAQAMTLVAQTLLRPGDIAAVESPTFPGSINAIRATGASMMPVPVDADGMDVDALEQLVRRRHIKLVTLQPRSHNPTGVDLAPERRRRLLDLARREGFFVVEDGVYADLRYESEPLQALRMDDPAHVIYVASFSKTVSAGLRVGWVAARGPVLERIAATKRSAELNTPLITELAVARFLAEGGYAEQLDAANAFYGERCTALLEALDDQLAGVGRVRRPKGGGHVWLTLPDSIDERDLYEEAVRQGVSFLPGGAMTPERPRGTYARLSYGYLDPPVIREGVKRLAAAVRAVGRANRQREALPVA